ncbi:MAG TPA: TonB-dependent copper receptor [Burkholderiales bacterium]|nr:TonB-dependent copper receptor [Burkholderiales bacterium]
MSRSFEPKALTLALSVALLYPHFVRAHEHHDEPGPIVVTAPHMRAPLEVSFDPRAPQQPLPANDGAGLLKTIPGMNVIRKGGTDGDPVFRGMAASRLNILLDGETILGGCGMRMDPPTAYIFPDSYDKLTLLKGPQTVIHGPGGSAGTVLFERKPTPFAAPGWSIKGAATGASFDRHDEFLDVKGGSPLGYVQGILTHARSGNYRDGNGDTVHSKYERWSATGVLGWTPDRDTRVELSAIRSDGEAAYADRGMDGSSFARSNYGLKFEKRKVSRAIEKIEAQAYYNYIDHVMDNFNVRKPPMNPAMRMLSNPDRETAGGRVAFTLRPGESAKLVLGADLQRNEHTARSGVDYRSKPRVADATFTTYGMFGEWTQYVGESDRLIAGLRSDRWKAEDKRASIASGMMSLGPNPTAGAHREETHTGGFVRYERDLSDDATVYAGFGRAERFPDYWELINKESMTGISGFGTLDAERTKQFDAGLTWRAERMEVFVSAFYSRIDDYILIQSQVAKGMRRTTVARNIDATTWGGEAGLRYAFDAQWKLSASIAYTRGVNETDDHALGQMPPLEGRIGLDWDGGDWFAGGLLRLVAKQDRYALDEGNIVGQDLGATGGFGVFSLNGGYRWRKDARITVGVDNLFDKTYAESISRGGATIPGFDQTARVNEPGRTYWIKAQFALE